VIINGTFDNNDTFTIYSASDLTITGGTAVANFDNNTGTIIGDNSNTRLIFNSDGATNIFGSGKIGTLQCYVDFTGSISSTYTLLEAFDTVGSATVQSNATISMGNYNFESGSIIIDGEIDLDGTGNVITSSASLALNSGGTIDCTGATTPAISIYGGALFLGTFIHSDSTVTINTSGI